MVFQVDDSGVAQWRRGLIRLDRNTRPLGKSSFVISWSGSEPIQFDSISYDLPGWIQPNLQPHP